MGRGSKIRVTHPKVYDIVPGSSGRHLKLVYRGEDVRGKAVHALKFKKIG
jgi:hypothetical protein